MTNQPIPPARASTLEMERIRYDPEWEIPTNYPPRKPDNPLLAKIKSFVPRKPLPASSTSTLPTHHGVNNNNIDSKETSLPPSTSHSANATTQPPTTPPKQSLLDRYLPPEKRYLGRLTRRAFLLLLLAILFVVILALGLGLGLGLKARKNNSVPLPWSDAGKGVQKGELTYYNPSAGAGACGRQYTDNDSVVAVSHALFDAGLDASGGTKNSNENVLCGRKIRVWEEGGKGKVEVTVVDRCTGCGVRDLDLSDGVFGRVTGQGQGRGRVEGRWEWV
ncbi:RlpA-like double-psi beta-barrel-protein domain-containing protein-containing protein [Cercophora samala]|uniref:RlpA-like double-psi beta-barrel-protein domain-containing protein-containing protein n=1 Tax=Cercophora samala TaxID=330535 RepID=A0AA40DA88_9PEZI|nr:RlpA-like double-psi beta-barrel-protein domain-containing protein-containing protein [Cercophora samala]